MQAHVQNTAPISRNVFWLTPAFLLMTALLALAGLSSNLSLAIGPNYWDLAIYYDAAHRIANGQIPAVDFLTPAGPLEYYQFYFLTWLFPDANPLLTTHWAMLLIALPLFAVLISGIEPDLRISLGLTLPFLFFALVPMNTAAAYPAPGFDGYGIYNRHPALLLYILVATLFFVTSRIKIHIIIGCVAFSLFVLKITAFAAGVIIIGYAIFASRIRVLDIIITALIVIACLGVIEFFTGIVSAYLNSILQLASLNEDSFSRRYKAFAGNHLDFFVPVLAAACLLAIYEWRSRNRMIGAKRFTNFRIGLSSNALWLILISASAFLFEIQNTGSQAFIYVLPFLLFIFVKVWDSNIKFNYALMTAIFLAGISIVGGALHRSLQTLLASTGYETLRLPELGPLGMVKARQVFFVRANGLIQHFADSKEFYQKLVQRGLSHSDILSSEPDFQIAWLINSAAAVRAIQRFEIETGRRIETLYTFDFTDPIPFLLERRPIRFVQIGLDAQRTLPRNDARMLSSISSVEAILVPQCPLTPMREAIRKKFSAALEGRQKIVLTPCWDLWLRSSSSFAAAGH